MVIPNFCKTLERKPADQFVKGKGFFFGPVAEFRYQQTDQKMVCWMRGWWLELRSCERKFLSRLQQNSTLVLYFFTFQTIISRFDKRFVERNTFGNEVSDVVVRKIRMSAMLALFYLRSRNVGPEFSQETAASGWQLLSQTSVSSFTFRFISFLTMAAIEWNHRSLLNNSWHFKSRTREQPELERPRAAWGSDSISYTKSPSLILIRYTHMKTWLQKELYLSELLSYGGR